MLIEDGQGSGKTVGITSSHRMKVTSISATPEHYANHNNGLAFNMLFCETPTPSDPSSFADDDKICFLYVKNESNKDMIIEGIEFRLDGTAQTEVIEIQANDGEVPIGGNGNTPANLNLGSGNVADGVFLSSNEITGVSEGTLMFKYYIESSNTTQHINFEQDFVIPTNNTLTIWARNGLNEICGMLIFFYNSPD